MHSVFLDLQKITGFGCVSDFHRYAIINIKINAKTLGVTHAQQNQFLCHALLNRFNRKRFSLFDKKPLKCCWMRVFESKVKESQWDCWTIKFSFIALISFYHFDVNWSTIFSKRNLCKITLLVFFNSYKPPKRKSEQLNSSLKGN